MSKPIPTTQGQVVDTIDLGSQQILREPVPTKDDGLDLGILTVPIVTQGAVYWSISPGGSRAEGLIRLIRDFCSECL